MWLIIILKVTRKQGFTLSLEDTVLEKPQGWGGGQIDSPSRLRVNKPMISFRSWCYSRK